MKTCPTCHNTYPADFSVCPRDATPLAEIDAWRVGAVIRGRYRILAMVGEGGMGAVYKAMHTHFQELRALKVIHGDLASNPTFIRRFQQEGVITRRLQHPNAVRVEDIDEAEDGRPFIVMELIEGQALNDVIAAQAPLATERVCSILTQAAGALAAAHDLGIVHRDIKPSNIFLLQNAAGEQVKVLDFGIAKLKEAYLEGTRAHMTLTGTGMLVGTPAYMSPEQAMGKRGQELDGRSDLYSLGIVAYQMLTGDLPFKADSDIGFAMAHIQQAPPSIRAQRPDLPAGLAEVIASCLEKNRDLRPANARVLGEALQRAQATRQTVAEPAIWSAQQRPTIQEPATPRTPTAAEPVATGVPQPDHDRNQVRDRDRDRDEDRSTAGPTFGLVEPAERPQWMRYLLPGALLLAIGGTVAGVLMQPARPVRPAADMNEAASLPSATPTAGQASAPSQPSPKQEGTILGTVTDPSGAVIPNVEIAITSLDTGFIRKTTTNQRGQYGVLGLHFGSYNIRASARGFKSLEYGNVRLHKGEFSLNFKLSVGSDQEKESSGVPPSSPSANSGAANSGTANSGTATMPPATSSPAATPKIAPPTRIRVSSGVENGLLTQRVNPAYPPLARQARIQGVVLLQATISKQGDIEDLQTISGHPMLIPAAMQAVKQWKYKPYLLNGQPVEVETQIQVNFYLDPGNTSPN